MVTGRSHTAHKTSMLSGKESMYLAAFHRAVRAYLTKLEPD